MNEYIQIEIQSGSVKILFATASGAGARGRFMGGFSNISLNCHKFKSTRENISLQIGNQVIMINKMCQLFFCALKKFSNKFVHTA